MPYNHTEIEARWREWWKANDTFRTSSDRTKPKYYVLDMFPYPSGSGLHVGHPKGYVATDIVCRARRMMGFNVLRPMGWDSFGLPAERQAVRENKHPREITTRNVATFRGQLDQLGLSYDWSREIATSDPAYYKWTQWIFLQLYNKGLAYKAKVPVNWCPALGTVLANEEVVDGRYVETGDRVEQRLMSQWMLRITDYAESLLAGLDDLDWPEGIKTMQREWIGRSEGARIRFKVATDKGAESPTDPVEFEVFTTRPDTLFGCTYVVLAPAHPLVPQLTAADQREAVQTYIEAARHKSDRERTSQAVDAPKTGVFTGAYALHPITGDRIPIWIADYVLSHYSTGAVFACPAHDERDHSFARTFDLPIVEVVGGGEDVQVAAYTGDGPHLDSDFLDGLDIAAAKRAMIDWLEVHELGAGTIQYRLRDWLFSRQRYWGEPFPMIELEDGTTRALSAADLPVLLPQVDEYKPTQDGQPPLARAEQWVATTDPETGAPAKRETNTMPQWAGSCWYYLRFVSPQRSDVAWDREEEAYWMPVDLYVGGAEHAVLHLLYARFWHHVLHDLGLVSCREPFQRLFNQGMVHATSFRERQWVDAEGEVVDEAQVEVGSDGEKATRRSDGLELQARLGRYHYPAEVEERDGVWRVTDTGVACLAQLEKMSKSRYNVENPDDVSREHGADALRLYEVFMGPLESGVEWSTAGVAGTYRFLRKVFDIVHGGDIKVVDEGVDEIDFALHDAIKTVSESILSLRFNTAISKMMIFSNAVRKTKRIGRAQLDSFVRILSPFAPHLGEELWRDLGHEDTIAFAPWPEHDESKLERASVVLVVQVNGKLRAKLSVASDISKEAALAAAKADPSVLTHLEGKTLVREIYVPGRLVNLVAK